MTGKPKFAAAMRNNICGNPDRRVRREAVAGTIHVYPMNANGKLYGAVVSGEHQFYSSGKGRPEQLSERARFTHLLVLKDQAWKVSRVLSYDHAPAQQANKLVEIQQNMSSIARAKKLRNPEYARTNDPAAGFGKTGRENIEEAQL